MRFSSYLIRILLIAGIICSGIALAQVGKVPRFISSQQSLFPIDSSQAYTFGYLEVPENRSDPTEKTIRLPIYIFKSRSDTPQKDPVIYTVGGPGSTTMPSAKYMAYYRYLDDRDVILVEQRGTYYAQPHLGCTEWAIAAQRAQLPGISSAMADSLYRNAALVCRDRFLADSIDLNAYHTLEIAADIEDLRIALGIEQYNLLTTSYSTKIAQVLMRDYPAGIRSVVMDSPLPLEVSYDEESAGNILASYDRLFAACESSPECSEAFPNVKERFFTFLETHTADPLVVQVPHPQTHTTETFYLKGKDLIDLLPTAGTSDIPGIPMQIERLLSGDFGMLIGQLQSLLKGPGHGDGIGMRLSVWCAEETPFASRKVIKSETHNYPAIEGYSPAVFQPEICDIWGVKAMAPQENQAVRSDIPTLLISGEYDAVTPPRWAKQMQLQLSNSFHMVFKGWMHTPTTNWGNPCAMEAAHTFFNDPGQLPQVECFQAIRAPVFQTK